MTDLLSYHPVTWYDRLLLDCKFRTPEEAHSVAIRYPMAKPTTVTAPVPAKPNPKLKAKNTNEDGRVVCCTWFKYVP